MRRSITGWTLGRCFLTTTGCLSRCTAALSMLLCTGYYTLRRCGAPCFWLLSGSSCSTALEVHSIISPIGSRSEHAEGGPSIP
ncbi:hypothetical protein V8C42DRAFT_312929 [Trichoderma barbatum]